MNPKFKAKLFDSISKFVQTSCKDNEWPSDMIVGDNTEELMTNSAANVFDAICDSIKYGKDNGNFE